MRKGLLNVFADVCCVVCDALVVLIVEAFALYNPECFKVLLVQCVLDLLPIHVGFRSTHRALNSEALLAFGAVVSCIEAVEDLLALFKRHFLYIGERRALRAFLIVAGSRTRARALNLCVFLYMDRNKAVLIAADEGRGIAAAVLCPAAVELQIALGAVVENMLKEELAFVHEEFLTVVVVADLDAVRLCHFCHFVEQMSNLDCFFLVAERSAGPDNSLAAELCNLLDDLFCRLCVDGDDLEAGLVEPLLDVFNVIVEVYGQELNAGEAQCLDGLELLEQSRAEAEVAGDAAERLSTDINFHVYASFQKI